MQKVNQESFQKLNEILNWISSFRPNEPIPQNHQILTFYVKTENDSSKMIKSTFQLPDKFKVSDDRYYEAVESVDRCILDLFFKAKIKTEELETSEMREELKNAINNDYQNHPVNEIESSWWTNNLPSVDELVNSGMLYNSEELTPKQLMEGYDNLKEYFHEMQFYKWRDVPLSLSLDEYSIDLNGFLIIPYNFEIGEFRRFLNQNIEKLRDKKEKTITQGAEMVVDYLDELHEHAYSVNYENEVSVHDLILCLSNLLKNKDYLENLNLKISAKKDEYQLNDLGVLTIPYNFSIENFKEFEKSLSPGKLSINREFHRVHKLLKQECTSKGEELLKILGLKEIDVTTQNSFHPYDILQFLNFLKENSMHLARFQWGEYKFILHDKGSMKIDGDSVYLPIAFSIEVLLDKVQSKGKKKKKLSFLDIVEKRQQKQDSQFQLSEYNRKMEKYWDKFKFKPEEYKDYLAFEKIRKMTGGLFDIGDEMDEGKEDDDDLDYFSDTERRILASEKK